jgi:hypothetical protein
MQDYTRISTVGGEGEDRKTLRSRLVFEERAGTPVKGEAINLLFGTQMLMGRDEVCEITIQDNRISRKHAILRIETDAVRLSDLGSTNGTTRNDESVTEEIILNNRDRICLGRAVTFEVRIVEREGQVSSVRLATGTTAFLLAPSEILIGKSDPSNFNCDLMIYDPDLELTHGRLEHFYANTFVVSLSPEKPVLVNNKPIRELEIHNGYTITMGKTRMRWEILSQ